MSLNCMSVYDDISCKGRYGRIGIALSTFAGRSTYVTYFLLSVLCRKPDCLEMLNVWVCLERQEVILGFVSSISVLDLGWGAVTYILYISVVFI